MQQSPVNQSNYASMSPLEISRKISKIHESMIESPNNEKIQLECLHSLQEISLIRSAKILLGDSGCLQSSITVIRKYPQNPNIAKFGCRFLANCLLDLEQNQQRFRACRGIEVLATLLVHRELDAGTVELALLTLDYAISNFPMAQQEAYSLGCLNMIQRLMKKYQNHEEIVCSCVKIIGFIVKTSLYAQREARESKILTDLCDLMRERLDTLSIQSVCVETLHLASDSNPTNQKYLIKYHCVERLYDCLSSYNINDKVLPQSLQLLQTLARQETGRATAAKIGVTDVVVKNLESFLSEGDLFGIILSLDCLANLLFESEVARQAFGTANGFEIVQHILENQNRQDKVCSSVLKIYRNVVVGNDNIPNEMSSAIFDCVVKVLKTQETSEELTLNGLSVLHGLYSRPDFKNEVDKTELKEMISKYIERFPKNGQIRSNGQNLLRRIERRIGNEEPRDAKGKIRKVVNMLVFLRRAGAAEK